MPEEEQRVAKDFRLSIHDKTRKPEKERTFSFGPKKKDILTVSKVADMFCKAWGENLSWSKESKTVYHEAQNLSLDITKARTTLGWVPKWSLSDAIEKIVEWHKAQMAQKDCFKLSVNQVKEFLNF